MVTIMVPLTCSKNDIPSTEPCAMVLHEDVHVELLEEDDGGERDEDGTNLLMVMIRLTPAASFTPRLTRNA